MRALSFRAERGGSRTEWKAKPRAVEKSLEKYCRCNTFPHIGKNIRLIFITEISPRTSLGRNDKVGFLIGFRLCRKRRDLFCEIRAKTKIFLFGVQYADKQTEKQFKEHRGEYSARGTAGEGRHQ